MDTFKRFVKFLNRPIRELVSKKPGNKPVLTQSDKRVQTDTSPNQDIIADDKGTKTGQVTGPWTQFAPAPPNGGVPLPVGAHPGNTGGKKGRSGGKSAAWKARMAAVLDEADATGVLTAVISGDILEQLGTARNGEPIVGQTKNKDRLGAIEFAAKYAHGLPVQKVEGELQHLLVVGSAADARALLAAPDEDVGDLDGV